MDRFICIFLIAIAIFAILLFMQNNNSDITYELSDIDNQEYLVRNLPDKKDAANLLATVKLKLIKLTTYLQDKYPNKKSIMTLAKRFNPDNISEGEGNSKYTSYSVNKGEKIVFCIRSRNSDEKLVDTNLLMFVALHELGHIMTKSVGHTEEFWNNFKFLLINAIEAGLYIKQNFRDKPVEYCGTQITDSPLR